MDIKNLVREDIRNLVPYEPYLFSNVIKLDANENPYPFPPEVMQEVFSRLAGDVFTRYPDPWGRDLKGKIAEVTGVGAKNIILGNGSDELIQLILQTFGGPGRRVVIPVPTFTMYKIHGQITGTQPVEVPRDEKYGLQIDILLTEIKHPAAGVTFIATPNNPSGNCVPRDQIERIVKEVKSLVVVDEAYIDFGGETCLPLLQNYPNLIILRSFSKVALAGLRVGYLLAHGDVTGELAKVKQPYNVNSFSQRTARVVLDYWPVFREQVKTIIAERKRLEIELGSIPGIAVFPSEANFILFKVPVPAVELHQQLLEQGILVRKSLGSTHGLQDCLRVTVGTRQENDIFLEKIKRILNS